MTTPSSPNTLRNPATDTGFDEVQASGSGIDIRRLRNIWLGPTTTAPSMDQNAPEYQATINSISIRIREILLRSNAPNFSIKVPEMALLWQDVQQLNYPLSPSWQLRYQNIWKKFDHINLKSSLELYQGAASMWSAHYSERSDLKAELLRLSRQELSVSKCATILLALKYSRMTPSSEAVQTDFSHDEYQTLVANIEPFCRSHGVIAKMALACYLLNYSPKDATDKAEMKNIINLGLYRQYSIADFLAIPLSDSGSQSQSQSLS